MKSYQHFMELECALSPSYKPASGPNPVSDKSTLRHVVYCMDFYIIPSSGPEIEKRFTYETQRSKVLTAPFFGERTGLFLFLQLSVFYF